MAHSRLEKIGTIYTRARGLLQSGAVHWDDRPLWYDIYKAYPPKEEPRFDRPAPNVPLKKIFYKEDKVRALFQKRNKHVGTVNLLHTRSKSLTQRFLKVYEELDGKYAGSVPDDQVYEEALDLLKKESEARRELSESTEAISLTSAFKEAQIASKKAKEKEHINVNVKDLFKE